MAKATKKKTTKRVTETHDGTVQGKRDLIEKLEKELDSIPKVIVGYYDGEDDLPTSLEGHTNFDFWLAPAKDTNHRYKVEITVTKI